MAILSKGKYVRKVNTKEVFINTQWLDVRDDMVAHDEQTMEKEIPTVVKPLPPKIDVPNVTAEKEANKEPKKTSETDESRAERVGLIKLAIKELNAEEDFTQTGVPKVESLEKILGMEISGEERNQAWEEAGNTPI